MLVLLSGCATTPPAPIERPIENSRVFKSSFDEAWGALIQVVAGEEAVLSDKSSGLVSFKKVMPATMVRQYAIVPKRTSWGNGEITVNILAKQLDGDNVKITVKSKIIANTLCGWGYGKAELGSNGKIEAEYLDKINNSISSSPVIN